MNLRFYLDPESGLPHIYGHGVEEYEVEEVLRSRLEDTPGRDGSRIVIGQTLGGRYLRVMYSKLRSGEGLFIITAYPLSGTQLRAFRRRRRRQ